MNDYKDFLEYVAYPRLAKAVVTQLGGWNEDVQQNLRDIAVCGVDGGFHGFIYYAETTEFFKRNRAVILEALCELASDCGESMFKMMESWHCLNGMKEIEIVKALMLPNQEDKQFVHNALAFFAAEEVAHWFVDWEAQDEN